MFSINKKKSFNIFYLEKQCTDILITKAQYFNNGTVQLSSIQYTTNVIP